MCRGPHCRQPFIMANLRLLLRLLFLKHCLFPATNAQSTALPNVNLSTISPPNVNLSTRAPPGVNVSTVAPPTVNVSTVDLPTLSANTNTEIMTSATETVTSVTDSWEENEGTTIVHTTLGVVSGVVLDADNRNVSAYLGIPYAAPPIGDLRFAKPQPADPWTGIFDASDYGPDCPQPQTPLSDSSENEDCLSLNIYVPQVESDVPLPIMISIAGGGFYFIGRIEKDFGRILAATGEVIVVTMNYRVGLFGFLTTNDDCARGNWGLWDQRLAIQWVKDNAERFGGDPNQITLFGKSPGANSILYQALSSLNSNNLFQRIIVQSPINFNFRSTDVSSGTELVYTLAKNLGYDGEETDSTELIQFLRNESASDLLGTTLPTRFYPVIDDELVRGSDLFQPSSSISQYDVLIGYNSGDHSILYGGQSGLTKTEYLNFVGNTIDQVCRDHESCGGKDQAVQAAVFVYNDIQTLNDDETLNIVKAMDMTLDIAFSAFAEFIAHQGDHVYAYEFTYKDTAFFERAPRHIIPSPHHIEDLYYVDGHAAEQGTMEQKALSYAFMQYWTNFARNG